MDSRQYERLYGMRSRLLAGVIALSLLGIVFIIRTGSDAVTQSGQLTKPSNAPVAPPAGTEIPTLNAGSSPQVLEPPKIPVAAAPPPTPSEPDPADADQPYVVQAGDCIWRIAENFCGSGFRWEEVYAANRDQIVDPDRIFPDQKFTLTCRQ